MSTPSVSETKRGCVCIERRHGRPLPLRCCGSGFETGLRYEMPPIYGISAVVRCERCSALTAMPLWPGRLQLHANIAPMISSPCEIKAPQNVSMVQGLHPDWLKRHRMCNLNWTNKQSHLAVCCPATSQHTRGSRYLNHTSPHVLPLKCFITLCSGAILTGFPADCHQKMYSSNRGLIPYNIWLRYLSLLCHMSDCCIRLVSINCCIRIKPFYIS